MLGPRSDRYDWVPGHAFWYSADPSAQKARGRARVGCIRPFPTWHYLRVASERLTPRLQLRDWRRDDLGPLAEVFAKPQVWHFPFRRGFSLAETEAFLSRRIEEQESRGWSIWAAEDRATRRLIGYIGLSEPNFLPEVMPTVEIGWRLDPAAWGRGLATEGARTALDFGFEDLGLGDIVSICEPDNVSSSGVMSRLGMHFDRETVDPVHGVPLRIYRLERAEWEEAQT
jgi:RimJ/RimL family protein N-acetyltransferase